MNDIKKPSYSVSLPIQSDQKGANSDSGDPFANNRLESLGLVAGEITHNIQNTFSYVLGCLDVISLRARNGIDIQDLLNEISRTVNTSSDALKRSLDYLKGDSSGDTVFNVTQLLEATYPLVRFLVPKKIEIKMDLGHARSDVNVFGEPMLLRDLMVNLCVNAAQAIDGCGSIFIDVELLGPENRSGRNEIVPAAEKLVRLGVVDSGCGIGAEHMERIFDPLYTTKSKSGGTGLGLASVRKTVDLFNGEIDVWSQEGEGSVFNIYLPVCR